MEHARQLANCLNTLAGGAVAALSLGVVLLACSASAPAAGSASPIGSSPRTATPSPSATARPSVAPTPPPPTIDPSALIAEIETGTRPVWMAESAGVVWVANTEGASVSRIDPATNAVVATIPIDAGKIVALAADDAFVFVKRVDVKAIDRIDIATNEVTSFPVESDYGGLALSGGRLWHAASSGEVLAIDPATGRLEASVPVAQPGPPSSIAADDGGAWVAAGRELVRITNGTPPTVDRRWVVAPDSNVALDAGTVWAVSNQGTAVSVAIDTGKAADPIKLPIPPLMAAATSGSLWLRGMDLDLRRVDPATGASLAVVPLHGHDYPGGFLIDGDEAWVANLDRGTVSRIRLTP
jgi:streptogramin lyase